MDDRGWICPVCGCGVAPSVTVCPCRSLAPQPYQYPYWQIAPYPWSQPPVQPFYTITGTTIPE